MTAAQVAALAEHMHIDNFRNNASVNLDMDVLPGMRTEGAQPFIRTGGCSFCSIALHVLTAPRTGRNFNGNGNKRSDYAVREFFFKFFREKW